MKYTKLETIIQLLLTLASGNLEAKGSISQDNDDYDAIITGINILAEELKHSTVSKDYLNSIYKGIADMLFILDTRGRIIEINEAVETNLGLSKKVLKDKAFTTLLIHKKGFATILKTVNREGHYYNFEETFFNREGLAIPISCTVSALRDKNGKTTGYLFIAKDVSKLRKTEEELKLKNKELDTFIYKAAHDLKSPLTSIQGLLNIAHMEVSDPVALKYFNLISRCSGKLENILTVLKETIDSSTLQAKSRNIQLHTLVGEVLHEVKQSSYYSSDVKVKLKVLQANKIHSKDRILFHTIYHVIENAYKFRSTSVSPFINIKIHQENRQTVITIEDNGMGIQKKYHEKIFDMFYKANNLYEGNGLGLYSARTGLSRIGGRIDVKSKPRDGSRFIISFPNIFSERGTTDLH